MIFEIEQAIFGIKPSNLYKIDKLYHDLNLIDRFFTAVEFPMIHKHQPFNKDNILSSNEYNNFLRSVESDTRLIYDSIRNTKNELIKNWNNIELVKDETAAGLNLYDVDYPTELPFGSLFINVTSAVTSKVSMLDKLAFTPGITAQTNNASAKVYHGKKYGVWIPNDVTNEDGLRAESNDTSVLVDAKDTFYEIESTLLQGTETNVHHSQKVINDDIILEANIKLIFSEGVDINYLTVKPHNHASGKYYELTNIVLSDGENQQAVLSDSVIIDDVKTITFTNPFETVTAAYLTFKQVNGYFIKYSIGSFKLNNLDYLVDFTGDALMGDSSQYINSIDFIKYKMSTISTWILDVIKPRVSYNDLPVLNETVGDKGFLIVESNKSNRKRWAIGIEDLDLGKHSYAPRSEVVTQQIKVPDNYNTISLRVRTNNKGRINFYVSSNDGLFWNRIDPIGTEKILDNFAIVPQTLYLNSDLSLARKKNNEGGVNAYMDATNEIIRIRAVFISDETGTPELIDILPIFSKHIELQPSGILPSGVLPSGQIGF